MRRSNAPGAARTIAETIRTAWDLQWVPEARGVHENHERTASASESLSRCPESMNLPNLAGYVSTWAPLVSPPAAVVTTAAPGGAKTRQLQSIRDGCSRGRQPAACDRDRVHLSISSMRHDDVFAAELARLRAAGLERRLRPVDGAQDTSIIVDGRRVLSLCSNNYLGLANHPELIDAAVAAARAVGVGCGRVAPDLRLDAPPAPARGAARGVQGHGGGLLFTSGYHANLGVITALVGAGRRRVQRRAQPRQPDRRLPPVARRRARLPARATSTPWRSACAPCAARRRLIVTDSIFSMDGDAAPLAAICDLAERTAPW